MTTASCLQAPLALIQSTGELVEHRVHVPFVSPTHDVPLVLASTAELDRTEGAREGCQQAVAAAAAGGGTVTAMRRALLLPLASLAILAGCGGSGSANPTTTAAPTTTAPATTAAPSTTINELARNKAVNEFIDAVVKDQNCQPVECQFPDNIYARYKTIRELALAIPGADVNDFQTALDTAWLDWTHCLQQPGATMQGCGTQWEAYEASFLDFYNALR